MADDEKTQRFVALTNALMAQALEQLQAIDGLEDYEPLILVFERDTGSLLVGTRASEENALKLVRIAGDSMALSLAEQATVTTLSTAAEAC